MAERIDIGYLFGACLPDRAQCRGRRRPLVPAALRWRGFYDAVYLGPTFYWKIAPKVLMSAAWETQIVGSESGVAGALNSIDFSDHRARLLLEFEF